ncbi:hypothetical protein [Kitasatospora viridis]|uniref:Uncharacterized protein n=1 Tax=Kitasatospora viridis TaxID=281105 RepID=A0A561UJT9_9ACTN|nr:hypothetical protein [Kitasatospora viridis]TWF99631.1 hypothetical protein FHX73_113478 [Kitasatospora viridis]
MPPTQRSLPALAALCGLLATALAVAVGELAGTARLVALAVLGTGLLACIGVTSATLARTRRDT